MLRLVIFLLNFEYFYMDYSQFVALYNEPYGTPIGVSVNLTDLGLSQYADYDLYESFTGNYIGKFHNTDIYSFSINPSGDVHAFYAQSATTKTGFPRNF